MIIGLHYILKSGVWADHQFIQAAAYLLGKDIHIHTESTENEDQYQLTVIHGDMNKINVPLPGGPLHLVYLRNLHYQSVIPMNSSAPAINRCAFV